MSFGGGSTFLPDEPIVPLVVEAKDIPRWLMASCRTFFNERRGRWPMFFMHAVEKDLKKNTGEVILSYFEFRLDGPFVEILTKSESRYTIEINILCIANLDPSFSDEIEIMLGQALAAFEAAIPVFRLGDQQEDDQTYIACLVLSSDKNEAVRVSRFGQANPDTKILQASVEGHYVMRLFQGKG